jgi:hypothetical protein
LHADPAQPTAGWLLVTAPATQAGQSVAIDPTGTVLGRDGSCELVLASQPVSRRHAMVSARDGGYVVEDLGSLNGTTLNGRPVVGMVRLADGDRLRLADVEVEFRLDGRHGGWSNVHNGRRRPLRAELHDAPGFSGRGLLLAVAGSIVGTVLTPTVAGQWGSLAAAALAPIIAVTFSTKRAGDTGRVRMAAVVILSATALAVMWTGLSVADLANGGSVLPGARDRATTFPAPTGFLRPTRQETEPPTTTSPAVRPPGEPAIEVTAELWCGTVSVASQLPCSGPVVITSAGTRPLLVTHLEVTGPDRADFAAGQECVERWLDPGKACEMTVQFAPSAGGPRTATLVIHQNLPPPDQGAAVTLTGTGLDLLPDPEGTP